MCGRLKIHHALQQLYEKTAIDLHRESSRVEKFRHFVYVRALIARYSALFKRKISRSKLKMRNANSEIHLNMSFFYRHHAQVFLVKTVQSVFRITLQINTAVTVFLDTRENTAKQVSLS